MIGLLKESYELGSKITVSINLTGNSNSVIITEQPPANAVEDVVIITLRQGNHYDKNINQDAVQSAVEAPTYFNSNSGGGISNN